MSLSYDEITEILKIIDSSSCNEVVIETRDIKLVVHRNGAVGTAPTTVPNVTAQPAIAVTPETVKPAAATAAAEAAAGQFAITAPMVGTFYRAPSPDAAPFVEIGDVVKAGQPVCLIEVMKLFTTINAEIDGRIVEAGAENGELVEYGRTLFVIEPL